jgi:hypothetical protein
MVEREGPEMTKVGALAFVVLPKSTDPTPEPGHE